MSVLAKFPSYRGVCRGDCSCYSNVKDERKAVYVLFALLLYFIIIYANNYILIIGKYTTRKIHKKLHLGPEWFIFHNLTREFINDVISVISVYFFIDIFVSM